MHFNITGKTALITGSNTGIGRGIASVLAREGATVVIHGRRAEKAEKVAEEIRSAGGKAYVSIGDLSTQEGSERVVAGVRQAVGHIDILVNNIGGLDASANRILSWFDVTPEQWTLSMQQNLISAVRMVHAFVPAMRERRWGRIINISAEGAITPPVFVPEYCAAKAGLNNLTVSLAVALARSGVTANAISPGTIHSEMVERMLDQLAPSDDTYENRVSEFTVNAMDGDFGRPEDLGVLAAFLASPFSSFVNGAIYRFAPCSTI